MYRFGPFSVDPARRVLARDSQTIAVTARAFDVLLALLERAGQVVGKDELLRAVWVDTIVEEANLSQHIFTLRKLLGQTDQEPYIATVPRRGYQFVAPVSRPAATTVVTAPRIDLALRLEIALPQGASIAAGSTPALAVAADGSAIVFAAGHGGTTLLYLRRLDRFDAVPLPGTEGACNPFLSPDGHWVGFEQNRRLCKAPIDGGSPFPLCDVAELRGATWTERDDIIFAPGPTTGLWRIAAAGGQPAPLTTVDFGAGERTHRWPHALAGGDAVLFTIGHAGATSFDEASLAMVRIGAGERRLVLQHASDGRCLAGRQLLWLRGGALLAAPFDADQAQVSGAPRVVAHGVAASATGAAHVDCAGNGMIVHVPGEAQSLKRVLVTVNRAGQETSRHASGYMLEEPRWGSTQGTAILSLRERSSDLWAYDFARGSLARLTFQGENFAGIRGPDHGMITFSSSVGGPADLFTRRSEGRHPPELLVASEFDKVAGAWSPDGGALIFTEYHPATGADLWLLDRDSQQVRPFLRTPFNEYAPVFAPDGRHLAYVTDQSGRDEVVVADYPHAHTTLQISVEGGTEPMWSPQSGELFFRSGNRVMRVDVSAGVEHASIPTTLFEGEFVRGTVTLANYDVTPDGREFLMVRAGSSPAATSLRVMLDGFMCAAATDNGDFVSRSARARMNSPTDQA